MTIFVIVAAFSLLTLSSANGQAKHGSEPLLPREGTRLELGAALGVTNIHQSINPVIPNCLPDTMVADSAVQHSIVPSSRDSSSNPTVVDTNIVMIRQKSALTAVLLSAVIPGGGQIYNGSYWKVPIIYGLEAFFVSQWISNNKSYQSLQTQWENSLKANASSDTLAQLQVNRDAYHDQRDSYAWYMAGVYALSVLDAYIDAELSGFDVSPSLGFAPDGSASAAILVRVKF